MDYSNLNFNKKYLHKKICVLFIIFLTGVFFSCDSPQIVKKASIESRIDSNMDTTKLKEENDYNGSKYKYYIENYISKNQLKLLQVQNSDEIKIGKELWEQSELTHYLWIEGGYIVRDSSLWYSIYENEHEIIYSVEKLVEKDPNSDLKKFKIIDTIQFNKNVISRIKGFKYPLNDSILVVSYLDQDSSIFKSDILEKYTLSNIENY